MRKRRKRLVGLGFMVAVILLFSVMVQIVEARRTPDWQNTLAMVWPLTQVVETGRAQRPDAFTLAAGYRILTGSRFAYDAYQDEGGFVSLTIALPEAPTDLYCVVVHKGAAARLLFVNYYTDNLYRSGWVVIDGGTFPGSPATQTQLDAIGCRLAKQP